MNLLLARMNADWTEEYADTKIAAQVTSVIATDKNLLWTTVV